MTTHPTTAAAQLHARGISTRTFGQMVAIHRVQRGMTQVMLADMTGSSEALISRLESGNRNPQRYMVARIVDALRLDARDAARLYAAAQMIPPGIDPEAVVALVERGQGS